jgi:hypothetical protein
MGETSEKDNSIKDIVWVLLFLGSIVSAALFADGRYAFSADQTFVTA